MILIFKKDKQEQSHSKNRISSVFVYDKNVLRSKIHIEGITRRWLINSFGAIFIILIIIEILFAFAIKGFFYYSISQSINGRSNELSHILNGYSNQQLDEFSSAGRKYVEEFTDKKSMELMIFDSKGNIITTSTGFEPDKTQDMPDYNISKDSPEHFGSWIGKLSSGERVMAVSRSIYSTSNTYIGAIRYCVSLENADKFIALSITTAIVIGVSIILFVLVSSLYFIRSIVTPMTAISATAQKIAQGDFGIKLEKKHNDEIGELCDTINYMARELKASDQMKNDFISSVSHELRTPLTAIKGWAETIKMDSFSDPEMTQKGLEIIINESERLGGLVEDLLDFSKMQNGRVNLKLEKMDIVAELTEAVYMFKEKTNAEGKNLIYTEPKILSPVLGDKNRLKQVFINIIDNAIKYSNAGGTVSVAAQEEDGFIRVTVNDNGCGIPTEHISHIKEKFYKANYVEKGSGIGLAIADEIVELHNGTLIINSKENVGTSVEIVFPVDQSGADQ